MERGFQFFAQERYVEAEREFRKAIEINPMSDEAHNNLGILFYNQGRFEEAVSWLAKAAELNPRDKDIIQALNLARTRVKKSQKRVEFHAQDEVIADRMGFTTNIKQERPDRNKQVNSPQVLIRRYRQGKRDFSEADLRGADLSRADLRGINLSKADLSGANLVGANLSNANLSGTNLSGTDLSIAHLTKADLSGANLSNACLSSHEWGAAFLNGANLSGANLSYADLFMVDLSGVNLSKANLSGASLIGVNLSQADLTDVNLKDANIKDEQLAQAKSLVGVILPDGTKKRRASRTQPDPKSGTARKGIELSDTEKLMLEKITNFFNDGPKAKRAKIILMSNAGASPDDIAKEIELSPSTVRRWRKDFEKKRLAIFDEVDLLWAATSVPDTPKVDFKAGIEKGRMVGSENTKRIKRGLIGAVGGALGGMFAVIVTGGKPEEPAGALWCFVATFFISMIGFAVWSSLMVEKQRTGSEAVFIFIASAIIGTLFGWIGGGIVAGGIIGVIVGVAGGIAIGHYYQRFATS